MIAHQYRFHGHSSLRLVFQKGKTKRSRHFLVRYIPSRHRSHPRVAVVVSKKIYKSAVKRNLIRRRIFEIVRHKLSDDLSNFDVVITVFSPEVLMLSHQELSREVTQLLQFPADQPATADTASDT